MSDSTNKTSIFESDSVSRDTSLPIEDLLNQASNNTVKEDENKVLERFDSLEPEDIFECMFYINSGMGVMDYLGVFLTQDEEIDLEILIESYCKVNEDQYLSYLGYIQ